jgi:hypothetical protein
MTRKKTWISPLRLHSNMHPTVPTCRIVRDFAFGCMCMLAALSAQGQSTLDSTFLSVFYDASCSGDPLQVSSGYPALIAISPAGRLVHTLCGFDTSEGNGQGFHFYSQNGTDRFVSIPGSQNIAASPDGSFWIGSTGTGNSSNSAVGRMNGAGSTTFFSLPSNLDFGGVGPNQIVVAPDATPWFFTLSTTPFGLNLSTRSADGTVKSFPFPTTLEQGALGGAGLNVTKLLIGPDGNVWFGATIAPASYMVKVSKTGQFTLYPGPANTCISGTLNVVGGNNIAVGSDGNFWMTAYGGSACFSGVPLIVKVTPAGVWTSYPMQLPGVAAANTTSASLVDSVAAGADGGIWFSFDTGTPSTAYLGRLATNGVAAYYAVPNSPVADFPECIPSGTGALTAAPNNRLYFFIRATTFDPSVGCSLIATYTLGLQQATPALAAARAFATPQATPPSPRSFICELPIPPSISCYLRVAPLVVGGVTEITPSDSATFEIEHLAINNSAAASGRVNFDLQPSGQAGHCGTAIYGSSRRKLLQEEGGAYDTILVDTLTYYAKGVEGICSITLTFQYASFPDSGQPLFATSPGVTIQVLSRPAPTY